VTARKHLPSLARTPVSPERLVVSPEGGAVLLLADAYARLVAERWEERPAPWKARPEAAVGLEDGRVVVASGEGVHVVSASDEVSPLTLTASGAPEAAPLTGASSVRLELVGAEVWVGFEHAAKLKLAAPSESAAWKRFLPPAADPSKPEAAKVEHAIPQADEPQRRMHDALRHARLER
jgi:hypothetical protein